ncbi:hypothetical protein DL764_001154 [Monosporascus ibericus]|uniref:Uncharacterized protein n=1 Tax=Monosporascus ibericus TaxID=155417 RepID=A0A4Q4TS76_9PEZI|nr:hypothetical protein DL764_001154 [Monosporascus ibericus]
MFILGQAADAKCACLKEFGYCYVRLLNLTNRDSDDPYSPEASVLDVNDVGVSDAEIVVTGIDPCDDVNSFDDTDGHVDAENLPELFDDAVHPPEYCCRIAEEVSVGDFDTQDYSCGTDSSTRFFPWRLDLQPGEEGGKMKGIKTRSSLGINWKVFRLVYEESRPHEARPETESPDAQGTLPTAVLALWLTL